MVRYKMIGLDVDYTIEQYRTWVVNDNPDFTAAHYDGYKAGTSPLSHISAVEILDPTVNVNYSIPDALNWINTDKTMPCKYGGQVAVLNGNLYMFGGLNDGYIYTATLGRPTDWVNTGYQLPDKLSGSQLIILNNTIYLFGGIVNGVSTSNIYTAPTSNPLSWTTYSTRLPTSLCNSQVAIIGSNIYLFGGYNTSAVNTIFRATKADPLTWVDTGSTLPSNLYGSQVVISGSNVYLLGGKISESTQTANIYSSTLAAPTVWSTSAYQLPSAVSFAQFCTIGQTGYLFGHASPNDSLTKIMLCNLANFLSWFDTGLDISASTYQSQLAIAVDRLWLFGSNGNNTIYTSNSVAKYFLSDAAIINNGAPVRNFMNIGFAPWKYDTYAY
jgi:hypothetical protein